MAFAIPWSRYGGAAGVAAVADYADLKLKPVSATITNSEGIAGLAILADVAGFLDRGPRVAQAVDGAADWGVGMLTAGLVRRHFTAPVTATPVATTAAPASVVASYSAGAVGVPAGNASAAADVSNSIGGY